MDDKASRYFLITQISLLLSVSLCILLMPQGLFANDGISYFSAQKATAAPYMIGLLLVAWFSFKSARALPPQAHPVMKYGFRLIALLLLLIVAIPYGINFTLEYLHTLVSALFFLVQFLIMWWLAFKVRCDAINLLLLLLMAAEMIITVMYLDPKAGYLLEGELAYQLTFGFAAYRSIRYVLEQTDGKPALNS